MICSAQDNPLLQSQYLGTQCRRILNFRHAWLHTEKLVSNKNKTHREENLVLRREQIYEIFQERQVPGQELSLEDKQQKEEEAGGTH